MAALEIEQAPFAVDGQYSLQEFVLPESMRFDAAFDSFAAEDEFPVIDLSETGCREDLVAKLARAAETWGFFKVVNHGVPLGEIQTVMADVRAYFAKPMEEKMRVQSDLPKRYEGYTPGNMVTDVDGKHPCWTERLFFQRRKKDFEALAQQVWQGDDGHVCQVLMRYIDHVDALSLRLIGLLSEGIGADSKSSQKFREAHDSTNGNFIAAHYPPCPRPDLARGLRAHTDPQSLSILYHEYPGLQLLKDGKWLTVKPEIGTLLVNVGDMLQVWSNGRYKSVQHRVALNSTTARYSFIFFKSPRLNEVVSAPEAVVDAAHPRKYKDVSWKNYVTMVQSGSAKAGHLLEKITIA